MSCNCLTKYVSYDFDAYRGGGSGSGSVVW